MAISRNGTKQLTKNRITHTHTWRSWTQLAHSLSSVRSPARSINHSRPTFFLAIHTHTHILIIQKRKMMCLNQYHNCWSAWVGGGGEWRKRCVCVCQSLHRPVGMWYNERPAYSYNLGEKCCKYCASAYRIQLKCVRLGRNTHPGKMSVVSRFLSVLHVVWLVG